MYYILVEILRRGCKTPILLVLQVRGFSNEHFSNNCPEGAQGRGQRVTILETVTSGYRFTVNVNLTVYWPNSRQAPTCYFNYLTDISKGDSSVSSFLQRMKSHSVIINQSEAKVICT